jgi:hypothetical protein
MLMSRLHGMVNCPDAPKASTDDSAIGVWHSACAVIMN